MKKNKNIIKMKSPIIGLLLCTIFIFFSCISFDERELNSLEEDALLRKELAKDVWILKRMKPETDSTDFQNIIQDNEITLIFKDSLYGKGVCIEFATKYRTRRGGFFTDTPNFKTDYCEESKEIDNMFVSALQGSISIKNDSLYINSQGPYNLVFSKK